MSKITGIRYNVNYDHECDLINFSVKGSYNLIGLGHDDLIDEWFSDNGNDGDVLKGCMVWDWLRKGKEQRKKVIQHIVKKTGWDGKELTHLANEAVKQNKAA